MLLLLLLGFLGAVSASFLIILRILLFSHRSLEPFLIVLALPFLQLVDFYETHYVDLDRGLGKDT